RVAGNPNGQDYQSHHLQETSESVEHSLPHRSRGRGFLYLGSPSDSILSLVKKKESDPWMLQRCLTPSYSGRGGVFRARGILRAHSNPAQELLRIWSAESTQN